MLSRSETRAASDPAVAVAGVKWDRGVCWSDVVRYEVILNRADGCVIATPPR